MGKDLNIILDTNHLNYQLELGRQCSTRSTWTLLYLLARMSHRGILGTAYEIMHPAPGSPAQEGSVGVNPEGHKDIKDMEHLICEGSLR